ncbi:hypothetical protein [Sporichthya polymorpha]|uniref:hypothetical protein n=1 Tax=Sporichthya polymorpha TaxID=35751 RepID=UPI000368AD41|nr:hypothetical protein [Sporichthya polymorpha]
MISPAAALNLVREELRSCVLPRLAEDDDYGRSVLVAAIGVLGELAPRVIEDDAWTVAPTAELARAATAWHALLPATLPELGTLPADPEGRADERRIEVLAACEATAAALWTTPPAGIEDTDPLLEHLRSDFLAALGRDIAAELARR